MKAIINLLVIIIYIFSCKGFAQTNIKLTSPNGNLIFNLRMINKSLTYDVIFKNKKLIENSLINLQFDDGELNKSIHAGRPIFRDTTEDYDLVVGKTRHVHTHYKEVTLPLESLSNGKKINIKVRTFDEGVAFRYEFVEQRGKQTFTLVDENSTFNLHGDPVVRTLFLPNFLSSHEGYYTTIPFSKVKNDTLMDIPTLFEFPGKIFMAITEAGLLDYAGMYLLKHNG